MNQGVREERDRGRRRRSSALRISVLEGLCTAVMIGVSESYLGALAVELGHRDTALGLLTTLPMLLGGVSQLAAGPLSVWLGGRKRVVVAGATVQALSHVGLIAIAWTGSGSLLALLGVKTLYWASGMIVGPPWGAWMANLIRGRARERYFAWRSAAGQVSLLFAYGGAGLLLHDAPALGTTVLGVFVLLSAVGFAARALSALLLGLQADPGRTARAPIFDVAAIRSGLAESQWRAALYVAALMLGAYVAVPFFTPYMLGELGLDYRAYAALTAVPIVTKALALPLCYPLTLRFGMRPILAGSIGGIALVAFAWSSAPDLRVIVFAQILSGIVWAGFEFASYQLLLQSAPPRARVEFLSLAATLIGVAQLAGALIGGWLLATGTFDYRGIIFVSAVARLLPLGLAFVIVPRRLTALPRLIFRLLSVRPSGGTVQRPIVGPDEADPKEPSDTESVGDAAPSSR